MTNAQKRFAESHQLVGRLENWRMRWFHWRARGVMLVPLKPWGFR